MEKCGFTQSVIPPSDIKQLPIIPLSNIKNFSKKKPTVYSENSFRLETSKIPQFKTQLKLQSQDMESTSSSLGVALSSNDLVHTRLMVPKPTKNI